MVVVAAHVCCSCWHCCYPPSCVDRFRGLHHCCAMWHALLWLLRYYFCFMSVLFWAASVRVSLFLQTQGSGCKDPLFAMSCQLVMGCHECDASETWKWNGVKSTIWTVCWRGMPGEPCTFIMEVDATGTMMGSIQAICIEPFYGIPSGEVGHEAVINKWHVWVLFSQSCWEVSTTATSQQVKYAGLTRIIAFNCPHGVKANLLPHTEAADSGSALDRVTMDCSWYWYTKTLVL